ncbi:MAG: winged helix-turn-helix domain-containing protein [Thermoanaerobaculaceae bacterium]|nr:winged helix-turn-helix domain-containing protein [Thermoanaerobaculaceae bacterium]
MTTSDDFRLGDWLVQPSLNRVTRGGETRALQPRFMDLLVCLSEHAGKVASKEEILDAVWAKEFVSEGTLTHAVAVIRQTLGDDVRSPRYIETIPTRGYRVIAPVAPAGEAEPAAAAPLIAPEPTPATKGRRALTVGLVSVAVVVAAAAGWGLFRWIAASRAGLSSGVAGRIVVLPFRNLGPAALDYLALGITDDITTRLAAAHAVGVISRASAAYAARSPKSARQIADELGVSYILEGTVRWESEGPDGARLRVNTQLIRATDDTLLWGESYLARVANVVEVGATVASRVVHELGVSVRGPEQRRLAARPTSDPDAYQAYLCGIRYRDLESREQLGLAVAMFERAVTLDPGFALAYAELSVAHSRIYHFGFNPTSDRLTSAEEAAGRALSLQPNLPEAHLALGFLHHLGRRDYRRALVEYSIAARDLPNDSGLFTLIADVHRRQGKWEEARAEMERVVDLDPSNYAALLSLGDTLSRLRSYGEADRAFQRAINLSPDRIDGYLQRFWNYLRWDGKTDRAERVILEAPLPDHPGIVFGRSYVKYLNRDFRGARETLSRIASNVPLGSFRFAAKELFECVYLDAAGDREGVARSCGAALSALEREASRNTAEAWLELGYANALLDHHAEAIRAVDQTVELCQLSADAYDGADCLLGQAQILARAGAADRAIVTVEHLLSIPSPVSVAWLRLDPKWDRLRGDPAFRAVLERALTRGPH